LPVTQGGGKFMKFSQPIPADLTRPADLSARGDTGRHEFAAAMMIEVQDEAKNDGVFSSSCFKFASFQL